MSCWFIMKVEELRNLSHYPHLLLFFGVHAHAHARSPSHLEDETDHYYLKLGPEFSHPIAVLIVVLVFVFFIIVLFSVYLRYYVELSAAASDAVVRAADHVDRFGMRHGLDPAVIRTFPVVAHSLLIKDMKIGQWSLECAVCLSEFQGYETLRLLPKCGHVFHPSCIDAWLASASTCPICRAKLAVAANSPRTIITPDQNQHSESQFVTINVHEELADRNRDDDHYSDQVTDYLTEGLELDHVETSNGNCSQIEFRGSI